MKVYVVTIGYYEDEAVSAVFSDEEAAKRAVHKIKETYQYADYEVFELDEGAPA